MIKVVVSFVDGSQQEFSESESLINQLEELKSEGYKGASLIHELVTDDWGIPPLYVKILGKTSEGKAIEELIPYN